MKFRFMLALQLGRLPSELASMTAAEEVAFMAYYRDDPWGDHRADIRSGQIAQILWNQQVKKDSRKKLTDFLPFYKKKAQVEEPDDLSAKLKDRFSKLIGK